MNISRFNKIVVFLPMNSYYLDNNAIMKTYVLYSINKLKRLGENLDAKTILCNKSWLIFNDSGEKILYIFSENGEILLTVNGIVSQGKWKYISANKSIVISADNKSYMLHPSFLDQNIMALNLDGTESYMLMIDEHSVLASKVKSLEDLNKYFLSIEEAETQKKQAIQLEDKKSELRKEALRAWGECSKDILEKNKLYKRYNKCSIFGGILCLVLLISAIICASLFSYMGVLALLLLLFLGLVVVIIFSVMKDSIIEKQEEKFVSDYIEKHKN